MAYFVEYGVYDVVTHMLEARDLADTPANRAEIEGEPAPADTTFI